MWANYNGEASSLCGGVVHIWHAKLTCIEDELRAYEAVLSFDEIASANRLIKKEDRMRSILSKAILRNVLSKYLLISAEKITFLVGEKGKPFVAGSDLQFNLSHSGGCLLIAVTRKNPIGVDVERVKLNKDFLPIAKRFFASSETAAIILAKDSVTAFYYCWTRKEAFVKAIGLGLSFSLAHFEVEVSKTSVNDSCLLSICDHRFFENDWTLRSVALPGAGGDYVAAVAVRGVVEQILYFNGVR